MSVFVYSVESFVLSTAGLAWVSVRHMLGYYTWLEDIAMYSQFAVSTAHLGLLVAMGMHIAPIRGLFITTTCITLFILYAYFECSDFFSYTAPQLRNYDISNKSMIYNVTMVDGNITRICCPNQNMKLWHRYIFFGGNTFFPITLAVTFAIQTVQMIVTGGGLSSAATESLWPGESLGYSILAFSSASLTLKYTGLIHAPCTPTSIVIWKGFFTIDLWLVLAMFPVAFLVVGGAGDMIKNMSKLGWDLVGLSLTFIYLAVLWFNMRDTGILTSPFLIFTWTGCGMVAYGASLSPAANNALSPGETVVDAQIAPPRRPRRTQFVLPIQANLPYVAQHSRPETSMSMFRKDE